jgi:hypothetical protein
MSVEIYGQRFQAGQPAGLLVQALLQAFAPLLLRVEPQALVLAADGSAGGGTQVLVNTGAPAVYAFTVLRPVCDPRLYAALLALLQQPGTVVYAPGSRPVVAHPAAAAELPPQMLAALGAPVCVGTADALHDALFEES